MKAKVQKVNDEFVLVITPENVVEEAALEACKDRDKPTNENLKYVIEQASEDLFEEDEVDLFGDEDDEDLFDLPLQEISKNPFPVRYGSGTKVTEYSVTTCENCNSTSDLDKAIEKVKEDL
jgi:hypothetical protein